MNTIRITTSKTIVCFFISILSFTTLSVGAYSLDGKVVIGSHERIVTLPGELEFIAKVDTGAANSSMHATDVEFYSQDSGRYVRFKTIDSNNKSIILDLPLHRIAKIKRHGGASLERAVVMMGVCLATKYKQVQVTLTDRSRFTSPFLIGASFLKEGFLVDVSNRNLKKANCNSVTSR
jgi:hypothetical protein